MCQRHSTALTVAILVVAGALSATAGAATGAPAESGDHALLDVPYMSQTPALCGGAAVAMVLRYWGERDVFPQDFAPLVLSDESGILTGTLVAAVGDRGWQAFVLPAPDQTARVRVGVEIDRGRPVIALIEVGPGVYHYVVIVGATDREVVFHDPAREPFRVMNWTEFDRAWTATRRWTMLVLPPVGFRADDDSPVAAPAGSLSVLTPASQTACEALVDRSVQLALAGDPEEAERGLLAATRLCPQDAAGWRELAGLRFAQSRWPEARDLGLAAARRAPDDAYAWQLVATSQYLLGDSEGALEAWNRMDEPRIDTTTVHGATRTRQPVVLQAAGWQPRQLLTPELFARAVRRLRALPVIASARVRYEPTSGGSATIDVLIDERPVVPRGWLPLASLGARALLFSEVRVDVAGPLGAGERMSAAWRWTDRRERVALGLAMPSPRGLPGILSLEGLWDRQSYDTAPAPVGPTAGAISDAAIVRDERRRVGLHVADWATSWLHWQTGAALDGLFAHDASGEERVTPRDHLALESSVDVRLAKDRVAFVASAGWWTPFGGGDRFGTGQLLAAWRSTADPNDASWSASAEVATASDVAPLALWHGAGSGQGRDWLLRAHPLLDDDIVTGPVFGRTAAHATIEYERPVRRLFAGGLSVAGFLDVARAWRRLSGGDISPLYVDAGAGLRVHTPGPEGAIRVDLAHGLRGGGTTVSAGWVGAWPRR